MDFWISALQCYLVACKSSEHLSSHPAPSPNRSACRPLWTLVTGPNDWYSDVVGIAATKLGSRLVCLVIKLNTTEHSSWCSYRLWWCHNSEMRLQWMSLVLKKKLTISGSGDSTLPPYPTVLCQGTPEILVNFLKPSPSMTPSTWISATWCLPL